MGECENEVDLELDLDFVGTPSDMKALASEATLNLLP